MTDDFDPTKRDPAAPVAPDRMRDALATGSMSIGGGESGVPGETLPEAGLTAHTQPAEGGRDEAEDDEPAPSR